MDNGKLGEIIGASVSNGTMPTAELVASVLTDLEILEEVRSRNLELSPVIGGVATESAANDVLEPSEALPNPVTPESLAEQLTAAYKGYETVATLINDGRKKKEHVEIVDRETVATEFEAWLSEDKLAYVAKAMEADPELRFTLVATPNTVAKADEIIDIAKEFGKNQPHSTTVWSDIYSKYTPEQLSGTDPSNGKNVKFSLIPNKLDPALYGTVSQQVNYLKGLQADNSFVGVPSVLEDVTFWNTLRAGGDSLSAGEVFERTYVRHFDLPIRRVDDFQIVPFSCVRGDGGPRLFDSGADSDLHARVSVG
jgi:hypothetical protein